MRKISFYLSSGGRWFSCCLRVTVSTRVLPHHIVATVTELCKQSLWPLGHHERAKMFLFFNLGYLGDRAELFKKREGSNLGKEKESQDWEGWETIRFYKEWGTSEGKDLRWVLPVLPSAAVLRVRIGSSVARSMFSKEVHHKSCLSTHWMLGGNWEATKNGIMW